MSGEEASVWVLHPFVRASSRRRTGRGAHFRPCFSPTRVQNPCGKAPGVSTGDAVEELALNLCLLLLRGEEVTREGRWRVEDGEEGEQPGYVHGRCQAGLRREPELLPLQSTDKVGLCSDVCRKKWRIVERPSNAELAQKRKQDPKLMMDDDRLAIVYAADGATA